MADETRADEETTEQNSGDDSTGTTDHSPEAAQVGTTDGDGESS